LTSLAFEPENEDNFATWVKVHDRVEAGEMPPKNRPRPDMAELVAFVTGFAPALTSAERAIIEDNGRAARRLLNHYEYVNTLRDLLDVRRIQIKDRLPEDGEKHRHNKIGEALDVRTSSQEHRAIHSAFFLSSLPAGITSFPGW
jgi:hypothetical protein